MTTRYGRSPSSSLDPSFSRLTFAPLLLPPSLPPTSATPDVRLPSPYPPCRLSPIGLDRYRSRYVQYIHLHLRRAKGGCSGRHPPSCLSGDPPYRRYQDCRPTDQCRERRRRLGVHRRLLGRTAGHRRTLENRLTALPEDLA